jgi:hypothetical protein
MGKLLIFQAENNIWIRAAKDAERKPKYFAVFVHHYRGRTCHLDFRVKMNDHLEGWTIMDEPKGIIRERVDTLKEAKYYQELVDWKFSPTMNPDIPCVARKKPRQQPIWLNIHHRFLQEKAIFPPGGIGATKFEPGLFYYVDSGFAYPGFRRKDFYEYFLDMKLFKGRMVIRYLRLNEDYRWLARTNMKDQTPYILSIRARSKKVIPPEDRSCIYPKWEKKVPKELRWWNLGLSDKERLKRIEQYHEIWFKGLQDEK